jgi:hypothetical protein
MGEASVDGEPGGYALHLSRDDLHMILVEHYSAWVGELPETFHAQRLVTWLPFADRAALNRTLEFLLVKVLSQEAAAGREVTRTDARGLLCLALGWSESTLARHLRRGVELGEIDAEVGAPDDDKRAA